MVSPYRRVGRQRAAREREDVIEAVEAVADLLAAHGVDRAPLDDQAVRKFAGLPERYREEFRGMAGTLPVRSADLRLYVFALSDVAEAVADAVPEPEGCTNLVVPGEYTAHGDPLVLKNRDVSGAGLRPQAAVTYPAIGSRHGFHTVSTRGSVLVYQGINDAGLVVANTFVNADTDTATEDELLNGVLVRRLLEECATVAEAREFVRGITLDRVQGLTLALADGTEATMGEIDPVAAAIRPVSTPIAVRTNHFAGAERTELDATTSTARRFERARDLADDLLSGDSPGDLDRSDLFTVAKDHDRGRGPDSICRHGTDGSEDPDLHDLDQSTTVSTTVYRGGTCTCHGTIGNPCGSSLAEISARNSNVDSGSISADLERENGKRGAVETTR